jgi:hypothetical protein
MIRAAQTSVLTIERHRSVPHTRRSCRRERSFLVPQCPRDLDRVNLHIIRVTEACDHTEEPAVKRRIAIEDML